MAISLSSLKKTKGVPNPLCLFYGVEKVGKTSLAAEFPSPVLIRTVGENPPSDVEIDSFPEVLTFAGLMEAIEALYTEDHSFKTLIVDAIDGVESLVWKETASREGWKTLEDPGYGKGYVAADSVWDEFFEAVEALRRDKGLTVILIGHTEIKNFDDPASTTYSQYRPNLHKRAADKIKAACGIIAFLKTRVSIKTEKGAFGAEKKEANGAGVRMIYLEERPGFIAGNRYSMPPEIQFNRGKGYDALAKYLPGVEK